MQYQGQSIGNPQHSTSPPDASSNLAQRNPASNASWVRRVLCVLIIAASCMWISCHDDDPGPGLGPFETTACPPASKSDTLPEFTQKCTEAMGGIEVPAFNCDEGTLVPENNLTGVYPVQLCDAPNVLHGVCDPGSRFQVLKQTDEVVIVAHCRKQNNADGFYGDVAVIQYNRTTGATCFYQALQNTQPDNTFDDELILPAQTTAPSEGNGQGKFPWLHPYVTAGINCVGCHDNGPFIRSPYLAQLRDEPKNRLPGTNSGPGPFDQQGTWNQTIPYKFIGSDFQKWKAYSVSLSGTGGGCMQCHRLGISSFGGGFSMNAGTAQNFGIIATDTQQASKNVHSGVSPIWMRPGDTIFKPEVFNMAFAASACATALVQQGNNSPGLPIPEGCSAIEFAQGDTCVNQAGR